MEVNKHVIRSEVPGVITEVLKKEGDLVKTGDQLFVLDSLEMRSQLEQYQAIVRGKKEKLAGAKDNDAYSDTDINQIQAELNVAQAQVKEAKLRLSKYTITSKVNGLYYQSYAEVGDVIGAGAILSTITLDQDQEVILYIPQKYLNKVELNEVLVLSSPGLPNQTLKGKVIFISRAYGFLLKTFTSTWEAPMLRNTR
jgi:multidrug resistance efflux pump